MGHIKIVHRGTGFRMTFANGYTASVEFGPGKRCEGRGGMLDVGVSLKFKKTEEVGEMGCENAEISAWGPSGELLRFRGWDEDTKGWVEPDEIPTFLSKVANIGVVQPSVTP